MRQCFFYFLFIIIIIIIFLSFVKTLCILSLSVTHSHKFFFLNLPNGGLDGACNTTYWSFVGGKHYHISDCGILV